MVTTSTQRAARAAAQLHEAAQDVARVAASRGSQTEGRTTELPKQEHELAEDLVTETAGRVMTTGPGAATMTEQIDMAGRAFARPFKSPSHVSVAAGRKGFKAELEDLRERMRKLGLGCDEVAGEIARQYRLRPRQAYRLAWGWSLNHAAAQFNALAANIGTDPHARAGMTGPHLCEHERWPDGGRRPSVYVLLMLAQMYETDALCLLDLTDHENLAPHDRLTLIRRPEPRVADPFGRTVLAASTGYAADTVGHPSADARGFLLSVPYFPGRLVIEISDSAANASPPIAGTDSAEPVGRQLTLVQGLPG